MQLYGEIVNFTVTAAKIISLKMRFKESYSAEILEDIRKIKNIQHRYTVVDAGNPVDALFFEGEIHSANTITELSLILRAPVTTPLVLKAIELLKRDVILRFKTNTEHDMTELLNAAARMESADPGDILFRLTTFTKNGVTRNGKKSIYDLSEAQRRVVLDKLRKLLSMPRKLPDPSV